MDKSASSISDTDHSEYSSAASAYGDDSSSSGDEQEIQLLKQEFQKNKMTLQRKRLEEKTRWKEKLHKVKAELQKYDYDPNDINEMESDAIPLPSDDVDVLYTRTQSHFTYKKERIQDEDTQSVVSSASSTNYSVDLSDLNVEDKEVDIDDETGSLIDSSASCYEDLPVNSSIDVTKDEDPLSECHGTSVSDKDELRLVMIGPTGTGKSSTGNTILGKQYFQADMCAKSITKTCRLCKAVRLKRQVAIVDTPGIFDTDVDNKYISTEILKSIGMTTPGPHAILLVVNVSVRFTKENQESVNFFVNHFGNELYNYLIVVFTRKDELDRSKKNIHEYLAHVPKALEELLARSSNRYIAFDNTAENSEKARTVQELFNMIDHLIHQNGGLYYTNELYKETDKHIKKRIKKIFVKLEQEHIARISDIREKKVIEIRKKFEKFVCNKEKVKGLKLSESEKDAEYQRAVKETDLIIQNKIDEIDAKFKPLMQPDALKDRAEREIESEKPGALSYLKKGALKCLTFGGAVGMGILTAPLMAIASPVIFGYFKKMDEDEKASRDEED